MAKLMKICLLVVSLTSVPVSAQECEFDCRGRCQISIPFGSVQDPACFHSCLTSEQVCKAGKEAESLACRSSPYYWQAYEGAKRIKEAGNMPNRETCDAYRQNASVLATWVGNELAGFIAAQCGTHICNALFP